MAGVERGRNAAFKHVVRSQSTRMKGPPKEMESIYRVKMSTVRYIKM